MTNRGYEDLGRFAAGRKFATVLADPPWQFVNRTGKMAPEHRRLNRYETLTTDAICALRGNWTCWGNQATESYRPTWHTYPHHSAAATEPL